MPKRTSTTGIKEVEIPFALDAQTAQQRLRSLADPVVATGSARFFKTGPGMNINVVEGNLLDQEVEVIVNAWNRNIIPWWLLLPQGVSGAIKKRGGTGPFKELRKHGSIPLGGAVLTSAGRLPFMGIIHVAGINMLWRASERSIRDSAGSRKPLRKFRF
jgi:hypothetical protein